MPIFKKAILRQKVKIAKCLFVCPNCGKREVSAESHLDCKCGSAMTLESCPLDTASEK
jgi:transcription elongation factor Elf1